MGKCSSKLETDAQFKVTPMLNGKFPGLFPPVRIGSSLWFVHKGSFGSDLYRRNHISGMMRYIPDTANSSRFVAFAKPLSTNDIPMICKHKTDSILLIRANFVEKQPGSLVVFDTKSQAFTKELLFLDQFNGVPSFVALGDYVHILLGHRNGLGVYVICSLKDRTVRKLEGQYHAEYSHLGASPIIKPDDSYKSSFKILIGGYARRQIRQQVPSEMVDLISSFVFTYDLFKFGGIDYKQKGPTDRFYCGMLRNGNPSQPIKWTLRPQYKMMKPLAYFGHIQHGPFIVIFGGYNTDLCKMKPWNVRNCTDGIYILDLRGNGGWIKSPIKCPIKMRCTAVLDANQKVHLMNIDHLHVDHLYHHFVIELKDIISNSITIDCC